MTYGLLHGIYTVLAMVLFVWICVWVMNPKRKSSFDEAARLPLDDDQAGR